MTCSHETRRALDIVAQAAKEQLAEDIRIYDLSDTLSIVEAQFVCSADSARHITAIARNIEEKLKQEEGRTPSCREGIENGEWVLLDYGDFFVHILDPQTRKEYALDMIWKDAPLIEADTAL